MSVLSQYKCPVHPRDEYPLDTLGRWVLNRTMNEDEITRIVTDAIRKSVRENTYEDTRDNETVINALYIMAQGIADEVWPTRSEESPVMPEEWLDAIEGK